MLVQTNYTVDLDLLKEAVATTDFNDFKVRLNEPTGNFFYDPWKINPKFVGTVWGKILDSLPTDQGEARIITLKPGTSYYCHADADDRWHLNIQSEHGYLCDLSNNVLYPLITDGVWYDMDAGRLHTAANFGNKDRIQLVVRQLLKRNTLTDPISIKIVLKTNAVDFRYRFDQEVSVWLNCANINGLITNFVFKDNEVAFDVERNAVNDLEHILPDIFEIIK